MRKAGDAAVKRLISRMYEDAASDGISETSLDWMWV